MNGIPQEAGLIFTRDDLETASEAVMLRFPLRQAETRRLQRMSELLEAGSELGRVLTRHTQHALVHCRGSHGTGDLVADAHALYDALTTYAALVRDVADEYRSVIRDPATPPVEAPIGITTPLSLDAPSTI